MKEYTLYAIFWVCVTIVSLCGIAGMTYYNIVVPSKQVVEAQLISELVEKYGINPMVIECMGRNWHNVSDFEICRKAAENPIAVDEFGSIFEEE